MIDLAVAEQRRAPWLAAREPEVEDRAPGARARAPWALAAALGVAVAYAAVSSGSIAIPEESRLQVGLAFVALVTLAGLLFGAHLRFAPDPRARTALWLLAGFAAWTALSITWSVAPDETWVEANRAVAYAVVVALGLALGSSLPRAAERVALGYLAIASAIALYAVGGKVAPWLFGHAVDIARLHAPLDYWNALALFCVLAVPVAIQLAADGRRSELARMAGQLALLPLLLAIALTYSRGGMIVLVVAVAVQIAFARERVRLAAHAALGLAAIAPALVVAVVRDDLSTDQLSASDRADDGLLLGFALLVGVVATVAAGRALIRAGERLRLGRRGRWAVRRASFLGVLAGVVALIVLTASGWTGDRIDSFTEVRGEERGPSRVLEASSGNRWIWWKEAAGAAWDEPLTGHGAGSFPLVHQAYRANQIEVRQPHSVPLEFLAETGAVGGALGLGGLGLLLFAGLARTRWRVGGERGYSAALAAGGVAFALHLWVDWDWDIPGVMLPALIFLGVLAAEPPGAEGPPRRGGRAGRGLALAGAGVVLGLFVASAVLPALAREKTSDALALAQSGRPDDLREAARLAALARRLDPFAVEPLFAAAGVAQRSGRPRLAAEFLTEAAERQPDNARVWVRLTVQQTRLGDLPAAFASSAHALELDPLGALSLFSLLASSYDERLSATATGTPLPLIVEIPAIPELPTPQAAPGAPAPAPAPAPSPAPAPVTPAPPAPAPTPPPDQGDPFRLEG